MGGCCSRYCVRCCPCCCPRDQAGYSQIPGTDTAQRQESRPDSPAGGGGAQPGAAASESGTGGLGVSGGPKEPPRTPSPVDDGEKEGGNTESGQTDTIRGETEDVVGGAASGQQDEDSGGVEPAAAEKTDQLELPESRKMHIDPTWAYEHAKEVAQDEAKRKIMEDVVLKVVKQTMDKSKSPDEVMQTFLIPQMEDEEDRRALSVVTLAQVQEILHLHAN